jgi:nicotinamidase-related amidase
MSKGKRILVIIDMQEEFEASLEKEVNQEILRQIKLANRRKAPIVFVRFRGMGEINLSLIEQAEKGISLFTTKKDDNGSANILYKLNQQGVSSDRLRICGINTEYCVLATVNGLIEIKPTIDIEVVKKGCTTIPVTSQEDLWNRFPKVKNIKLV